MRLKIVFYGYYYCNYGWFNHKGIEYRFFKSRNFDFWCGYICFKLDKTVNIVSIPMQFQALMVKTLFKHTINNVLYFGVKKWFLNNLKLYHSE